MQSICSNSYDNEELNCLEYECKGYGLLLSRNNLEKLGRVEINGFTEMK